MKFVGHPLLDLSPPRSREELLRQVGLGPDAVPIALLPGSRLQEVKRLLPIFLKAFDFLNRKHPKTLWFDCSIKQHSCCFLSTI